MTEEKLQKGFSKISPERRREIARMGGKAAQKKGTGHKFTADSARAAGQKGGKAVSTIPGHMSKIGKSGAAARLKKKIIAQDPK